ncbi:hypothetical protein OH76DRAFT_857315 [Lentinus brumalis]|uniref:Uncharacterized protein n=1 Tax=Lentinus brumalis TaxID=2498619 RepID=A0A371DR49_9APHY|nr:hypothetical protein OH76DRAFT_857315 [Polyporus brumalis]
MRLVLPCTTPSCPPISHWLLDAVHDVLTRPEHRRARFSFENLVVNTRCGFAALALLCWEYITPEQVFSSLSTSFTSSSPCSRFESLVPVSYVTVFRTPVMSIHAQTGARFAGSPPSSSSASSSTCRTSTAASIVYVRRAPTWQLRSRASLTLRRSSAL